jgi:hypothetical protein
MLGRSTPPIQRVICGGKDPGGIRSKCGSGGGLCPFITYNRTKNLWESDLMRTGGESCEALVPPCRSTHLGADLVTHLPSLLYSRGLLVTAVSTGMSEK